MFKCTQAHPDLETKCAKKYIKNKSRKNQKKQRRYIESSEGKEKQKIIKNMKVMQNGPLVFSFLFYLDNIHAHSPYH
jgi:hypothetical protein